MTDVAIKTVNSAISFDADPATTSAAPSGGMPGMAGGDVERLRALLRPIIVDLLGEEMARHRRMRG